MNYFYRKKILIKFLYFTKPSLSFRLFSNSTQKYKQYHSILPFTHKERILINNIIISLLNDSSWIKCLTEIGIPSFIVRNHQFRSSLLDFIDKSNDSKSFLRDNISSLVSFNSNIHRESNELPSIFIKFIHSFVTENMPNLIISCQNLNHLADFRNFERESSNYTIRRSVHLHIGPPNSGKTHEAISRLAKAKTGVYCSPLRLLAWEMYNRLNSMNVPCSLLTGQENVYNNQNHLSCTIEMIPLDNNYEVAVLDEMQMVGDRTRGYAWTKAFFGIKAPEIHVCGSPSCLTLVKKLVDLRGDLLEVSEHSRLNKLKILENIVTVEGLEPGDCVVCFSREEVFSLRDQIESTSYNWNLKNRNNIGENPSKRTITSVVYGSLPPETRLQQVESFNKRETKILIASDVIGMGVNVSIKRIIFHKLSKYDGINTRTLNPSEIQQIAGRAGRYGLECGEGEVSCMKKKEHPVLIELMSVEPPQIEKAVISPNNNVFEAFTYALKQATGSDHSLLDVTQMISSMAKTGKSFVMCDFIQVNSVSRCLEGISLPFHVFKQYLLVPMGSTVSSLVVRAFAASHSLMSNVKISNIINESCIDINIEELDKLSVTNEIRKLELLYETLEIYTWLSNKFPSIYLDKNAVLMMKTKVSELISRLIIENYQNNTYEPNDDHLSKEIIRPEFLI